MTDLASLHATIDSAFSDRAKIGIATTGPVPVVGSCRLPDAGETPTPLLLFPQIRTRPSIRYDLD